MMGGTWRRFHPARLLLATTLGLAGCDQEGGDYLPVAAITHNGFARDEVTVAEARGREIHLWGFVDSGNLYGDEDTRRILGDWWSGEGPSAGIWRFDLKAEADDPVGRSFAVFVPKDAGREKCLARFVADARTGEATRVFVTGRLFTFPAPTQARGLTGLYLEMASSRDIRFDPWEGDEKPEASHLPPPEVSHPGSADDASPASPDPNRR